MMQNILESLNTFAAGNLTENALHLFQTLGYESERRLPFEDKSFADFSAYITAESNFNEKNAIASEWKYVDLLFQLTESELTSQNLMFDETAIDQRITSYLFFVIELTEGNYSRTALSQITREVNKVFQIPAMILFKYGALLTLAVIDRQPHKRDETKDVLRKVTLVKDINFQKPHRAHLDILADLSLPKIKSNPSFKINSFLDLHHAWQKTLDVELITNKFFRDYKTVFDRVEREVEQTITDKETARLFTQRLFNRLMFIYFLQKKGWLMFENSTNYLRRLFDKAQASGENFYRDRLYWVFFYGLSNVGESTEIHEHEFLRERRGEAPYLNGGLFEIDADGWDERGKVELSNQLFTEIFKLFEHYNFTVEESTLLEVQVAIDPEILGRVFEELVTGRHESGSYYTPRQIVSFMCRESLKYYLKNTVSEPSAVAGGLGFTSQNINGNNVVANSQPSATADGSDPFSEFVDEGRAENLSDPEAVLDALKKIRVCDPACGSGAYLLGMMQELLRLRDALFTSKHLGDASLYNRKREIIENNVYGVDKDRFAVQIASLRLWLSLAIESKEPRPLPNLKYKIGCGDALLAPLETDLQPDLHRRALIEQFRALKAKYSSAFDHEQKREIDDQIKHLRVQLAQSLQHLPEPPKPHKIVVAEAEATRLHDTVQKFVLARDRNAVLKYQSQLDRLTDDISDWKRQIELTDYKPDFFDWTVEFAEIFEPDAVQSTNFSLPAGEARRKPAEAWTLNKGGFDVVLANPPYIRQELLGKDYKENGLKPNFQTVYSGTADIYVYFFARANAMLKTGGVGCFISSNKWLRAGYGEKLRQLLLDATKFHLVVDFGELPVFKAATFPAIFLWQNAEREETPTNWAVVKDLQTCYAEGVREHILRLSETLPPSQFGIGKSRLASIHTTSLRETMEQSGVRLKEYVNDEIYMGIKTGLIEAFIIDRKTKEKLIAEDKRSEEIIKPILAGDDVRKYETHFREQYLIFTRRGIDINQYSAVEKHLSHFREDLTPKTSPNDKRGRKPGLYKWFEVQDSIAYYKTFENPKIIYPDIGKAMRFTMEIKQIYGANTVYLVAKNDWYLLAVLNSANAFEYLKGTCTALGDENDGGRLRFFGQYLETLPIPNASDDERETIARLAKETQNLHRTRRALVEQFLLDVGTSAAQSTSRNPLEQPWTIDESEFARRTKARFDHAVFHHAKDETFTLTEQITGIEREIDQRVAALYGVKLDK